MQSQVVSGVPPPLFLLSLQQRPSFHLSFPLFFLLLCLSVSLSLSLLWPFICPHPSSLSRGISLYFSERVSWYKLPLLGSGRGRCTVGSPRSHRCTTLGFCHVERWHIEFFCGLIGAYLYILLM